MKASTITVTEEVLLLLARVHFANAQVFFAVSGRYARPKGAYEALLAVARGTGFLASVTPRFDGKALGAVFFLTPRGAEAAAELAKHECPPVFRPDKDFSLGHVDYLHRMKCAHVAARFWQWVDSVPEVEPALWRGYWQKGPDRVPLNSVRPEGLERPIVPDWLLRYEHGGDFVLLAVEVERTTGLAAMKRRLRGYALALEQRLIQATAGHAHAPVVAIVSEEPETLRKLVLEVRGGGLGAGFLETYRGNFVLASAGDLDGNGWGSAFYTLDGRPCALFGG